MLLKYTIKADTITFWCNGIDEKDNAITSILNKFFLDLSKEKKVFFHGYRLPDEDIPKLIEPSVILAKAEDLLNPFHIFLHLSNAKIKSNHFDYACETTIYYFENEVKWSDFLAASIVNQPLKLIKKGILSAYFISGDQGADFWFGCNKTYEKRVLQLFECMSELGYEIQKN